MSFAMKHELHSSEIRHMYLYEVSDDESLILTFKNIKLGGFPFLTYFNADAVLKLYSDSKQHAP